MKHHTVPATEPKARKSSSTGAMDPVCVVGSFGSAEEALEVAAERRPDVPMAIALIHRMH